MTTSRHQSAESAVSVKVRLCCKCMHTKSTFPRINKNFQTSRFRSSPAHDPLQTHQGPRGAFYGATYFCRKSQRFKSLSLSAMFFFLYIYIFFFFLSPTPETQTQKHGAFPNVWNSEGVVKDSGVVACSDRPRVSRRRLFAPVSCWGAPDPC